MTLQLPADAEFVRTTPRFTDKTVPAGLLAAHRVAQGSVGMLRIVTGQLDFVWDDDATRPIKLCEGDEHTIEPDRLHHLVVAVAVEFEIDFYKTEQTKETRVSEPTNIQIITDFVAAWSRLDPDELASYFAEDGCYHNMPAGPVCGRDNVRNMIAAFTADWTATEWDLLTIVGDGDVVMAERLDRTTAGDKSVDLPCNGVFEMENGKIKMWRDYFDMATFARAMA